MPAKFGGHMGPPPLRDTEHLLGLAGLRDSDKTKIELTNKLYKCAIQLLKVCMELGCMISIENPARSWLWALLTMLVNATNDTDFKLGLLTLKLCISMLVHMEAPETNARNC